MILFGSIVDRTSRAAVRAPLPRAVVGGGLDSTGIAGGGFAIVFAALAAIVAASLALAPTPARAATLTVHVKDTANAVVSDAVVYAIPAVLPGKPPAPAEIAQVARAFTPLVTVVQTGGAVSFPNRDTVKHQIYSFSPAKVFQLKLYAGLPEAPIVFDKAGVVVLGCNIHDAMVAYIVVVDTPYFAKSTASGVATLDGLPAGEYKISVWHPRMAIQAPPHPLVLPGAATFDTVVDLNKS